MTPLVQLLKLSSEGSSCYGMLIAVGSSYASGCNVLVANLERVYAKAVLHELSHLSWTIVRKELLSVRYGLSIFKSQVLKNLSKKTIPTKLYLYTDDSANYQRTKKAIKQGKPSEDLPPWEKNCISSIIDLVNELKVELSFIPGGMNPADCLSRGDKDTVDYGLLQSTIKALVRGTVDPNTIPTALTAISTSTIFSHLKDQCSQTEVADVLERIRQAQRDDGQVFYIKEAVSNGNATYKDR
ncbi:hypothetical protein Pmar_PMAR002103, partial [Perkinsus marinus ATCC 50983]